MVCARRWPGLAAGALRAVWRAVRSGRGSTLTMFILRSMAVFTMALLTMARGDPRIALSPLQTAARSAACGCSLGTYILAGDVQALAPRRHAHTAAAHAAALGPAAAAAALTTATVALAAALGASERLRLTGHPAAAAAAARARWRGGVDAAAAAPHAAPATAAAGGPRRAWRAGARQARDALTSRLQPSAPPGCSPVRPACNPVYQACSPNPPSLQPCASSPATPCTTPPRAASRRWPRPYP